MKPLFNISFRSGLLLLALYGARGWCLAAPVAAPVAGSNMTPGSANIVFPESAGVFNVKSPEFGAKGDGITDDTAAIQKALTQGLYSHRVVYLPDGVYLISDTLKWQNAAEAGNKVQGWGPFLQLQGQSRAKTILRLKPGSPGFGDAENPKAMIATGSSGGHGDKTYRGGEGNEAFENHLRNFSVDTGQGSAGAVGIDFQASNCGAMRHISIRGEGFAGINLTRRDNGPALIKDVSVEGFDFGLRIYQEIAHFTLEDVTFKNQNTAGIWMRDAVVGARHISSQNRVPAIQIAGVAVLALFDSDFSGGQGAAAIATQGTEPRIYVRNLKTAGYASSVRSKGQIQKPILAEWSSDAPLGNNGGKLSLGLPVRDTPEWFDGDSKNWAMVPAPSGGDDTGAIQSALDSGKATVFFPFGRFRISDTLRVPGTVKRIQGTGTQLNTVGDRVLPDGKPMVQFVGGKAGDLTIFDRFELGADGTVVILDHLDAREVVMSDLIMFGGKAYRSEVGAGPLFVENVAGGTWRFAPGTQVWARQFNAEGADPMSVADGATVWSLGNKHESHQTIFEAKNGAKVEQWASFSYTFGVERNQPAYIVNNASFALQMGGMSYMGANGFFDLLVKDTQGGKTSELRRAQVPGRNGGAFIPLYVSVSGAQPAVAANPATPQNNMNMEAAVAATIATGAPGIIAPKAAMQAVAQTAPKTFKAPDFFDGEENGKPAGNPLEVGGKAMWTAAQIWPDDIFKRDSYKPMIWAGDTWRGAYEWGGQPAVKVGGGKVEVTSRGGWGGGGQEPGNKRAAMIFSAPAKGLYKVSGIARAFVWEGDKAAGANLTLLKHDATNGKISRVKQVATPNETEVPIEAAEVELNAGDELIFLNAVNAMYTASATTLSDLKLEFSPTTGGVAAPATAVKVGQTVEIGGQKYKVVRVEGKQITLQLQ